jgi:X-X-X-Leu-X-X-Gly heptad repeat protein
MAGIRGVVQNLKAADGFRKNVQNTVNHVKEQPGDIGEHINNIRSNVEQYQDLSPGAKGVVNRNVQKKVNNALQPENAAKSIGEGLATGITTFNQGTQQLSNGIVKGFANLLSGNSQNGAKPPE